LSLVFILRAVRQNGAHGHPLLLIEGTASCSSEFLAAWHRHSTATPRSATATPFCTSAHRPYRGKRYERVDDFLLFVDPACCDWREVHIDAANFSNLDGRVYFQHVAVMDHKSVHGQNKG